MQKKPWITTEWHKQQKGKLKKKKKLKFKTVLLNSKVYSVSTAVCASYMVSEMLAKLTELLNDREIITILKLIYPN